MGLSCFINPFHVNVLNDADVQEVWYDTPGTYTFTVPEWVQYVWITAFGAGGGGWIYGGGGAGSAIGRIGDPSSGKELRKGDTITVTVGTGGTSNSNNALITDGGFSKAVCTRISMEVGAYGGTKGSTSGPAGTGGSMFSGEFGYGGGAGSNKGGGGSAGSSGGGADATSYSGGQGGPGSDPNPGEWGFTQGGDGQNVDGYNSIPGFGGGGRSSSNGGNGLVIIKYIEREHYGPTLP